MSKNNASLTCLAAIAAVLAVPAFGQDINPAPDYADGEASDGEELVVYAALSRGQVDVAQPPIQVLDVADIAAYGASSVADLVAALAPQTGSARGRGGGPPVFLVNGLRVSSFREFRSYPPEAIEKVEILPEEVAQRYGFSADQRVLNFIMKKNFSSREIEAEYGQPDRGGFHRSEVEATYLQIAGPSRLNLNFETNDASLMTEADRNLAQVEGTAPSVAGDPDPARYRSLTSDTAAYELSGNWTTALGDSGSSLSINGTAERSDSYSLLGVDRVVLENADGDREVRTFGSEDPLELRARNTVFSIGSTLNAPVEEWQFTATFNASHARSESQIDRPADTSALVAGALAGDFAIDGPLPGVASAGFDEATTITKSAEAKLTMMGQSVSLPAGDVSVTLDAGYDWLQNDNADTRNPGVETQLTRGNINAGINLAIPLTSRDYEVLGWAGDLTLNLGGGVDHLSDFGTLTDWTAGLNWGLSDRLNVQTSYIVRGAAPSLGQLGNPEIITPNVPVYDFQTQETALVAIRSGGNRLLSEQSQRDFRISASWELPMLDGASVSAEYNRNHSEDVSAGFPLLTPAIEAAFADRVTRDVSGRLIAIDQRPVTFAEQDSSRLQFSLNMSGALGKARNQDPPGNGGGATGAAGAAGGFAGGRDGGAPDGPRAFGGAPGANFDPERFQALRTRLCGAQGEPAADTDGPAVDLSADDLAAMPEPMRARLTGPDGAVDPERLQQMRSRICSQNSAAQPDSGAGGPPPGAGGRGPGGFRGPGGPGGPGGFRGPGGPGGGSGQGRWFFNLSYTLELENEVLIADGIPVFDQLAGDSVSSGGTPRHSAQLVGGMFYRGFGMRAFANYSGASRINGSALPGSTDLELGSLATVNLRLFANLGEQERLVRGMPFLKGTRLALSLDNLFDARQRVTDSNGEIPLSYDPFRRDPVGRYISIELRKVF